MTIGRKASFRLAAVLVLLVAATGLLTACGGGAAAGALIGAGVGAAIGSTYDDCYYYDCGCYDCDPYYYYKAGDGDYDEAF
ncbi:MAG: hypothetical protein QNJ98_07850 [Planctomycetota bacterium]|nr:hypothetical protein [Planctomycetota bacterium]